MNVALAARAARAVDAIDWTAVMADLDARGAAVLPRLLSSATCARTVVHARRATGRRSASYVSSSPSGAYPARSAASFQPRFTALSIPVLSACPPSGKCVCAASPARKPRPAR